jgi:hydrogenase 3 maturation protease
MSLKTELESFLGINEGRRAVVVGIGSPMRGDDAIGLRIVEYLTNTVSENVLLLSTDTAPESYTGSIRDFKPTHVILVDAANFHGKPGEARIIQPGSIVNDSVSTHSLPLNILIDYIYKSICENVILIGVQGVDIEMGHAMTPEVEKSAKIIAELLSNIL